MRWSWVFLVFLFSLVAMRAEQCYGCKKTYSNLPAHLDNKTKTCLREAFKQKKAEDARAKAAEAKQRLKARHAQLQLEREASMPVLIEPAAPNRRQRRVPGKFTDMLPTSLKGLPHLRLKPGVTAPIAHCSNVVIPPPSFVPLAASPRPHATVEDAPDDLMDDARPPSPPPPPAPIPQPPPAPIPIDTQPNRFGVFRRYTSCPRSDPEEGLTLDTFADAGTHLRAPPDSRERNPLRPFGSTAHKLLAEAGRVAANSFAPFLNWSAFKLMEWQYTGSVTKFLSELQHLVDTVVLDNRFKKEDLVDFSVDRAQAQLDNYQATGGAFSADDGWREGSVLLRLPKVGADHDDEDNTPGYLVKNIWHRSFVEVIKSAFRDPSARHFHWFPHRLFHKRATPEDPNAPPERLFTDVYNSDAMIRAHEEIQKLPRSPDDPPDVEYVVAGISVYSDSMRLASFGTASLWPIYAYVLNMSKYLRLKPAMFAAHHLAYIPSLPAGLFTTYRDTYNVPPSEVIIRFLKHELVHKIWLLLLDKEFMNAYEFGILILCGDGIWRQVFPRIFFYSADYPEKCLMAGLKTLARLACPDCAMDRCNFWRMGMKKDLMDRIKLARQDSSMFHRAISTVREWIFKKGVSPDGANVKRTKLGLFSMLPTRSAFSEQFAAFGQNVFKLFVPDQMHEFELGVWKGTFTHLVRILIAAGRDACQKLDERFSMIPTFGRATIRRFSGNVSRMKQLAARDFEQILKCAIPCFENLLPEPFNSIILDLLFELGRWHALAKLQLHSDSTITALHVATSTLGQAVRAFCHHVCPKYATRELPRETQSRQRHRAAAAQASGRHKAAATATSAAPKFKAYTVPDTPKYHRLGDYARVISEMGTHDNLSTQTGEFEHRRAKRYYGRTNKTLMFGLQIGLEVRRAAVLNKISQSQPLAPSARKQRRSRRKEKSRASRGRQLQLRFEDSQPLPPTQPEQHYYISSDPRYPVRLDDFLYENDGDAACKNFERDLKDHLFRRLPGGEALPADYMPTDDDLFRVRIEGDRLFQHKVLRVNFTRYDMCRDQDSINPRTHPDIMMLAPDGVAHPYLYARVIGIFHVKAYLVGDDLDGTDDTEPEVVHVLWVRWFDIDPRAPGGFKVRRLPRLKWAALDDDAFGFLSPDQVLRAAHLMPAFAHGESDAALPGYSVARREENEDLDWNYHYVGIFVDRDMFMRYYGGAVGHQHGKPKEPQPPPVTPEQITPLSGHSYDDESEEDLDEETKEDHVDLPEEPEHPPGVDADDSESETSESESEVDSDGSQELNSDDDEALGPEDGEAEMDEDEYELAHAGFASW
ncbi:hypothetical protein GSI_09141 [Ganoderma sinense ZZ0214-1]|uniref:Uncharacterized protein n=1 Tax=Ganoderma sinense ZZ0214-1 TaxID=1077348 RepID=A0A2G8S5Q2_9APHY|nr:hypothetical protein GSI_09141 [Ganoderma sinense ZZ0214-1]